MCNKITWYAWKIQFSVGRTIWIYQSCSHSERILIFFISNPLLHKNTEAVYMRCASLASPLRTTVQRTTLLLQQWWRWSLPLLISAKSPSFPFNLTFNGNEANGGWGMKKNGSFLAHAHRAEMHPTFSPSELMYTQWIILYRGAGLVHVVYAYVTRCRYQMLHRDFRLGCEEQDFWWRASLWFRGSPPKRRTVAEGEQGRTECVCELTWQHDVQCYSNIHHSYYNHARAFVPFPC